MLAIHSETSRAYCRVVIGRLLPRRPAKRNSPGFFSRLGVVVDGFSRLLRHLEPDRLAGLSLTRIRPIDRVTVGSDVVDLRTDDIASPQLAINR
jgi:hypothetical protein